MLPKLPAKQPRIVWLDVLRLCAIFMVICIHCSDPFNVSPEARSNPDFNLWGGIYGSFLRPCVPLFVMITGILLLPVKMSFEDFYKKRLLRIAVPFLLWSVLYNLFPWLTGEAKQKGGCHDYYFLCYLIHIHLFFMIVFTLFPELSYWYCIGL